VNLLALAEADLAFTLEDDVNGFGRSMTYTTADGLSSVTMAGQVIRRGVKIDPGTGMQIAGDEAFVTFRLSTFQATLSGRFPEKGAKIVTTDTTGATVTYGVPADQIMIDRTLGVCTLGLKRIS
jgi:hypothetical protein